MAGGSRTSSPTTGACSTSRATTTAIAASGGQSPRGRAERGAPWSAPHPCSRPAPRATVPGSGRAMAGGSRTSSPTTG
ncbi:hypothetical protein ACF09T_02170, partial [Streptomyces eurythermus]